MISDNGRRMESLGLVAWPFPVVDSPQMKIQVWQKQVFWTVAFVAGLLAWFAFYHVPALIDSHTKGMSADVAGLKSDVGNGKEAIQRIDNTINGMMKELLNAQLASLKGLKKLSTKDAKERLDVVISLTGKARGARVFADPQIVAEAGKSTLELTNNPQLRTAAWNATEQLLAYRSFLNATSAPSVPNPQQRHDFSVGCRVLRTGGDAAVYIGVYGTAPKSKAALLYPLSGAPVMQSEAEYFIVSATKDCAIILDGQGMRNVIVRDSMVEYDGGPLVLDHVYFVNCTFKMRQVPPSIKFSNTILASVPMNFSHLPS